LLITVGRPTFNKEHTKKKKKNRTSSAIKERGGARDADSGYSHNIIPTAA